ncbi:MAG: hypothetical protein EZS26_001077 [Candidatus Ordinivivax streblomastigis]|jgi:hypothetical protein|uniref:Uncharacterized protein n=1 Tax=Candidatus Ordinivivax streblomastigis TaxID=2540710 RepID=A0A5M8P353_9BACT|nr:MAG: hypothetical protein EZS26_001077 [Candidatus Ordinivivax streblomastigis]
MINENNKVTIIASTELNDMKLKGLVGKEGYIIENLTSKERKNRGYMVELIYPYKSESIWFIPLESVKNAE